MGQASTKCEIYCQAAKKRQGGQVFLNYINSTKNTLTFVVFPSSFASLAFRGGLVVVR
jgi:hypothetical protein